VWEEGGGRRGEKGGGRREEAGGRRQEAGGRRQEDENTYKHILQFHSFHHHKSNHQYNSQDKEYILAPKNLN
jgi:hypothetical protein